MLDPRIILAGQGLDLVGTLGASTQAAAMQNQVQQQNQLSQLYATQGAGIAQGQPDAINALAGLDPMAALNVQGTRLGMDAQRQGMQAQQQRMDMLSREERRAVEEQARTLSAQQRAAEAAQIEDAVKMGLAVPDAATWDAQMAQIAPDMVGKFDQRQALAAKYMSVAEILKMRDGEPVEPLSPLGKEEWDRRRGFIQGEAQPTYRPATPDEAAQYGASAGQINTETGQFTAINPPSNGITIRNPDGTITQIGGKAQPSASAPSSPAAMIATIDGILSDPALGYSTGAMSLLQNVPGTPMRRFGARAKQLEGQAFLQAFESLKGGGAITEMEGQKATQAIGRLDTAQSAEDYSQALQEVRSVLELAQSRMGGGMTTPPPQAQSQGGGVVPSGDGVNPGTSAPISDDDLLRMYGN